MKNKFRVCLSAVLLCRGALADVNILVTGSSQSFDSSEKAFNAQAVADELQNIFDGDASAGAVNVVFDDIFTTKAVETSVGGSASVWPETYHRCSLAQYYFWPDGQDARLNNMKSAGGTAWDYVVLMDDPYLLATMPGVHAQGVKLVAEAALSGGAKVLLMMQWPGPGTASSAGHFGEVAYRVGDSAGISVVPAGYAWDSLDPACKDTSAQHPTPNGTYLAASAIYAEICNRSAATGSVYNVDDSIADHAFAEVHARKLTPQYSGNFSFVNPFAIRGIKKRQYSGWHRGTSSEDGIKGAFSGGYFLPYAGVASGWTTPDSTDVSPAYPAVVYDFDLGRGNKFFEDWKRYIVDTNFFNCSFAFPMQDHSNTGNLTMRYGIDKRYYAGSTFDDGTDLGIGYRLVLQNEVAGHGRCIPIRLLWSLMVKDNPTWTAYADTWHMHGRLNVAISSFLYTILSGRCAVGTTGSADYLYARRLGYETAWRMSALQLRPPGFEVMPASWAATNVSPVASQTLSVRFINPPTSTVYVAVSTDDPAAGKVSPGILTFTPSNYMNAQTVFVTGEAGPAGDYAFHVVLSSSSADPAYDGISDSWDFYNVRSDDSAKPVVFSEELFSYSAGTSLHTTGAGNGWSGGWKADWSLSTNLDASVTHVLAGSLSSPAFTSRGLSATGNQFSRAGNATPTSIYRGMDRPVDWNSDSTTYFSALVNWAGNHVSSASHIKFMLGDANTYFGLTADGTNANKMRLTVRNTTGATAYGSDLYDRNATYMLVAKVQTFLSGNDIISLAVFGPSDTLPASDPAWTLTASVPRTNSASVFGYGHNLYSASLCSMDELRIGGTWDAVTAFIPAPLSFSTWISAYAVGTATNMNDNPDGDIFDNLVEFALGGDPSDAAKTGILPALCWINDGGGTNWVSYVHAQRVHAADLGLVYTVETSTNLLDGAWNTNGVVFKGTGLLGEEFESVTNLFPVASDRQRFIRLRIAAP